MMSDAAAIEVGGGDTWFNSNEEGGRGSTLFKLNRDPFFDALSNIFDHKERGRQYRDSEPGLGWIGAPLLITTGNTCVKRSISSSSSFTSHAATDFLQFCQNYSHDDGGAREQ